MPLAAAPAPASPPSSWRRSPPTTARWPGSSLPSTHRLRCKNHQSDEIHCKVCFRWLLLLWNRTTPSCRLTPASSPLTSVSSWTTRLDSMKVFISTMVFISQAIYEICKRSLQVDRPTYTNLNRIIAQVREDQMSTLGKLLPKDNVVCDGIPEV